eukprot:TRINITY_DN66319_c0_g1_i1.p1 TRINITY_DN66319_c0_g1~~TRINITY_DN66319_c0_g1_i1.p1  ORF type:complete len:132 (+),score=22.64 TRINITY_DN66319_c0_g1_i1:792-1187(+)
MTECLGYSGKILSATVSRAADKWFVSFNVQMSITPSTCENQAVVGVDLGIKTLATLSNGEMVQGPKALRKMQKKLKRLQPVSYTHLRAHETSLHLVCRLLLEKKKKNNKKNSKSIKSTTNYLTRRTTRKTL